MSKTRDVKHKTKESSSDISIDVLAVLSRRKMLLLAALLPGAIVALCYLLLMPPAYQSQAQILLMPNDSGSMASSLSNSESAISEDILATHMSLLQSKRIINSAVIAADLHAVASIVEALKESETATDYIISNLFVTRGGEGAARDARVLTVAFRHSQPEDTQVVTNAILNEYRLFIKSKFADVNKEAVGLISRARVQLEEDIHESAQRYRKFRAEGPMLGSSPGTANIYSVRYQEMAAELSQLLVLIDESKGRMRLVLEGLKRLQNTDAPDLTKLALIDHTSAERLGVLVSVDRGEAHTAAFQALQPERAAGAQTEYSSLLSLRSRLRQAATDYGSRHPDVKSLAIQVEEMERFMKQRAGVISIRGTEKPLTPDDVMLAYISLLENDLIALEGRKLDLEKQMADAEENAKVLIDFELQDEGYRRELTLKEELYNSVVERLRDINMQRDSAALIQEVIEEPMVGVKVSPNLPIAAIIAALTSMLLGGMTVLIAEASDKSIRASEDLEEIYNTNIITHIPEFQRDAETRLLLKRIAKTKPQVSPSVIAYHDPKSRLSEAFRAIRTQLLFSLKDGGNVVAVTSPCQGDGKSTTTANLAVSIANTGKSVLLMDCDMRRPALQSLFGLSNTCGLLDIVNSELEPHDAWQLGPCDSLTILTTGELPDNPAEILTSDRFRDLIETVRNKFDFVIVDCPPVLPVSDPAIISPLVDLVLLVTSLDPESLPRAKQCQKTLQLANAKLAGIVVNRAGVTGSSGYVYAPPAYMQK